VNVRTKLRGAFAAYIALLAALSIYHVRATRRAVASSHDLANIATRLSATSAEQLSRVADAGSLAEKYRVTGDTDYAIRARDAMRDYDVGLRSLDSATLSGRERELLTALSVEAVRATDLARGLTTLRPRDSASFAPFHASLDRLHNGTRALAGASREGMNRELAESERSEDAAEQLTVFIAAGAVLLSLVLSALLARSIIGPLAHLAEGAREVSAGRFGHRLTPKGNDEFAQVAREFNVMTERLDELDRMKREFVSKVSHDLKTPLSSMQETTGVLLDEVPGSLTPKQRQLLEINQESGQRLSSMLGKLLDLSRIEAGLTPERQVVDVRPLVRRSVERIIQSSTASRVSLSMSESAGRLLVRGDPEGLTQVFDNLLDNALKFSPFDGQVTVRVADLASRGDVPPDRWTALRRHGTLPGAVLVTVADEGSGIADDDKERVFARFYQTEAGRAVRGRGVGLGLAICREIVVNHGGAIWVVDNEPRGSVFHVLLPGAVRVGVDAPAPALAGARQGGHAA